MARRRLDAELVRRGLARSREHAQQLVTAGRVRVSGGTATKAATQVDMAAPVVVVEASTGPDYVSRGAHKLVGALHRFDPDGQIAHLIDLFDGFFPALGLNRAFNIFRAVFGPVFEYGHRD